MLIRLILGVRFQRYYWTAPEYENEDEYENEKNEENKYRTRTRPREPTDTESAGGTPETIDTVLFKKLNWITLSVVPLLKLFSEFLPSVRLRAVLHRPIP